jgi:hypothetical protein
MQKLCLSQPSRNAQIGFQKDIRPSQGISNQQSTLACQMLLEDRQISAILSVL